MDEDMLAAAMIPLLFLFGLLALFAFGAWPVGLFTGTVVFAMMLGLAVGLVRLLGHLDAPRTASPK